jgi:probable F420-dependent oxidoreductase
MKFTAQMHVEGGAGEPEAVAVISRALESAGFDALSWTEHPAPSHAWGTSPGGHASYDPLVALSYCAAATKRIHLLTYLLVLPYHEPFAVAKSAATLDRLSGGRLRLGVGTGYLLPEFDAVGCSFGDRNELFDRCMEVLRNVWTRDAYSAPWFADTTEPIISSPSPVQLPHPPLWIGGNSRLSRQRAATMGSAWMPLMTTGDLAATLQSASIPGVSELQCGIEDCRARRENAGLNPDDLSVQIDTFVSIDAMLASVSEQFDLLGRLTEVGATHFNVALPHEEVAKIVDTIGRFGQDVIAKIP